MFLGATQASLFSNFWNTGERDWVPTVSGSGTIAASWPGIMPSFLPNSSNRNVYLNENKSQIQKWVDLTNFNIDNTYRAAASAIFRVKDLNIASSGNFTFFGCQIGREDTGWDYFNVDARISGGNIELSGAYNNYYSVGQNAPLELNAAELEGHWLQWFMCYQETGAGVIDIGGNDWDNGQVKICVYDLSADKTLLGTWGSTWNGPNLPVNKDTNSRYDIAPGYVIANNQNRMDPFAYNSADGGWQFSGYWMSFGQTFDPEFLDPSELGVSTATIGGVDAWYNGFFVAPYQQIDGSIYHGLGPNNLYNTTDQFGTGNNNLGSPIMTSSIQDIDNYWSTTETPDGGGTL